jgi:hypothetical protein
VISLSWLIVYRVPRIAHPRLSAGERLNQNGGLLSSYKLRKYQISVWMLLELDETDVKLNSAFTSSKRTWIWLFDLPGKLRSFMRLE